MGRTGVTVKLRFDDSRTDLIGSALRPHGRKARRPHVGSAGGVSKPCPPPWPVTVNRPTKWDRSSRCNTPAILDYSRQMRRFKGGEDDQLATLTKRGRSRISRAIVRDGPALPGGPFFGTGNGPFFKAFQHRRTSSLIRQLQALQASCQRRTTREADLSTQQTGAQAPPWLPCTPRHDRRPQGSRRAPRAWPQAPERLTSQEISTWIG